MGAKQKTSLILWLMLIVSIVLCVQPFNFTLRLVGFVLATIGGFSAVFLRRQISRNIFIVLELLFIATIAVFFVNAGSI